MYIFFFLFILIMVIFLTGFALYGFITLWINRTHAARGLSDAPSRPPGSVPGDGTALEERDSAPPDSPAHERVPSSTTLATPSQPWRHIPMLHYLTGNGRPFYDRLFFRAAVVGVLTLIMLVPLDFVHEMARERSRLQKEVVTNISSQWGLTQSISGPILAIPYSTIMHYTETYKDDDGKIVTVPKERIGHHIKLLLPSTLDFEANLNPKKLHRGIYNYVVYTTPVAVKGTFRMPPVEAFADNVHEVFWQKAWLSLGVTDLKAITRVDNLDWNGKESQPFNPGTDLQSLLGPGFHTVVGLTGDAAGTEQQFSLSLNLNGSGGLYFTPVGERTTVTVTGDWPHPSFSGDILPTDRKVNPANFKGYWDIPHLARTYPQMGDFGVELQGSSRDITSFLAGVDLFEAVSLYTQVNRATKYGALFIGLTFLALLAFELLTQRRMHLFQYGLVGIAMCLFYLVLLSVAEHSSFLIAFIAASAVSVAMNGLYITASLKSKGKGLIITALLIALYALLYALLQMEDYALVMGTALVVFVVGVLMYLTRNLPTGPNKPEAEQGVV